MVYTLAVSFWNEPWLIDSVCNSSQSMETTSCLLPSIVTALDQKGLFLQWVSLYITVSPKFIVRAEGRGQCHEGALSLQLGGANRDSWIASLTSWLNGHEAEQTPGDSGEQGSLACYSSPGCKESHMT